MKFSMNHIYKNCLKKKLVNNTRKNPKPLEASGEFNFGKMQMEKVNIVSWWLSDMRELSNHSDYSFGNIA